MQPKRIDQGWTQLSDSDSAPLRQRRSYNAKPVTSELTASEIPTFKPTATHQKPIEQESSRAGSPSRLPSSGSDKDGSEFSPTPSYLTNLITDLEEDIAVAKREGARWKLCAGFVVGSWVFTLAIVACAMLGGWVACGWC